MAQNSQSSTASRASIPGTANADPIAPALFTAPARREYIPDAKRQGEGLSTPEMEKARALFASGDYQAARAEARRLLKDRKTAAPAMMEAQDLIDRTDLDHGPLAAAVGFLIMLGLMLMFFATNGK